MIRVESVGLRFGELKVTAWYNVQQVLGVGQYTGHTSMSYHYQLSLITLPLINRAESMGLIFGVGEFKVTVLYRYRIQLQYRA